MLPNGYRNIILVLFCGLAAPLQSQTVRGMVLSDSTSEAVVGAEIVLLNSWGATVAFEVTDPQGRFEMSPPPGRYSFRALRMGYAPTVTPELDIPESSAPIDLTILLPSEQVVLEPVVVTDTRLPFAPGPLEGFYERKRRGWGLQLSHDEIEEKAPGQFTDILRGLSGVRVVGAGRNKFVVQMVGQLPRLQSEGYFDSRGWEMPAGVGAAACPVTYYVDGIRFIPGDLGINEILVSEVEAVEVYRRASETPADFLDSDSRCGVVVIWTKRGP